MMAGVTGNGTCGPHQPHFRQVRPWCPGHPRGPAGLLPSSGVAPCGTGEDGDQHPVGHRGAGMVTPRRTAFFRDRPEAADLAGTLGEARAWGKGCRAEREGSAPDSTASAHLGGPRAGRLHPPRHPPAFLCSRRLITTCFLLCTCWVEPLGHVLMLSLEAALQEDVRSVSGRSRDERGSASGLARPDPNRGGQEPASLESRLARGAVTGMVLRPPRAWASPASLSSLRRQGLHTARPCDFVSPAPLRASVSLFAR